MADVLGENVNAYWASLDKSDYLYYDLLKNPWLKTNKVNAATDQNFTSWSDYYGPHESFEGDGFTATVSTLVSIQLDDGA